MARIAARLRALAGGESPPPQAQTEQELLQTISAEFSAQVGKLREAADGYCVAFAKAGLPIDPQIALLRDPGATLKFAAALLSYLTSPLLSRDFEAAIQRVAASPEFQARHWSEADRALLLSASASRQLSPQVFDVVRRAFFSDLSRAVLERYARRHGGVAEVSIDCVIRALIGVVADAAKRGYDALKPAA